MDPSARCKNCGCPLVQQITIPSSPTPHLHRTLHPPDASETVIIRETISHARPYLAELDDEIARMQAVLDDLRRKREELHKFSVEHDAFLAPIRRLPSEILIDIFKRSMPEWGTPSFSPKQAPLLFTQVCAGWRKVVLSAQNLWSSITVIHDGCLNESLVDLWLSRAISSPLSIRLDAQYQTRTSAKRMWATIALLVQYCDRWTHVELGLPASIIHRLTSVRHRLLWLESVRIENQAVQSAWPQMLDAFEYAPRLRRLQLEPGICRHAIKVPWSQLQELDAHYINVTECLETLHLVPNLRKCVIGCRETWFEKLDACLSRPFPTIHFPYLLTLCVGNVADPSDLFNHLELPVLRELHVGHNSDQRRGESWLCMQPFMSLLSRSSHTLCKLVIEDHSFVQVVPDLAVCLRNTPLLSELVVHGVREWFSSDLLDQLTRRETIFTGPKYYLVPELTVLDITEDSIDLRRFADMIQSRWRIDDNFRCATGLKSVKCELSWMFNLPAAFGPQSLGNLLKCREEGMEISIRSTTGGGGDLLSGDARSVKTI